MDAQEYSEGEVLTGAQLYLYLLRQNEEQLRRAQEKLQEYSILKETLHLLTERSRRRVLAPVAGGLAYYSAELNATNTILVLLGDGWFAERSAAQAAEIAGRRIDFLRREAEVLQQEQNALRTKQDFFLSELPEAQHAMADILAERQSRGISAQRASQSSIISQAPQHQLNEAHDSSVLVVAANTPDCYRESGEARDSVSPLIAVSGSCVPPSPSSPLPAPVEPATDSALPLDYASIDATLATFDELDELTEDELIALEAELCEHLDDDEYVERVMMERMIEKKERRVRAELNRLRSASAAIGERSRATEDTFISSSLATSPQTLVPAATAGAVDGNEPSTDGGETLVFRTPGDIGQTAAKSMVPFSTPEDISQRAEASSLSERAEKFSLTPCDSTATLTSPRVLSKLGLDSVCVSDAAFSSTSVSRPLRGKERHVRFAPDVKDTGDVTSVTPADIFRCPQVVCPGDANSFDASNGVETDAGYIPSLPRSMYTVGDIVEHDDGVQGSGGRGTGAATSVASIVPTPLLLGQRQNPKRKSLFMRELEGD